MYDQLTVDSPSAPALPSAVDTSALIAQIYDVALDPARWPGALRMLAEFAGAHAAAIFSKDAASKSGNTYADDGVLDPEHTALYFSKYVKFDPSMIAHCYGEIDKPAATADIMDYGEFLDTRFYREWVRPQRLADGVFAPLERSATSTAMFGFFRHDDDGPCDAGMRQRIALLAPHVRKALAIGQAMELRAAEAASFADTLDGLSAGVFLVDGEGRLAHANEAGHAMLAERSVLEMRGGRLSPREDGREPLLAEAESGTVPLSGRDGVTHMAHVLPLASGARRLAGERYSAAAAVFVRKAKMDAPNALEALARQYQLTPTELRVLLAIVEAGNVPDTAEQLGIAVSTVKTHVHRLLSKTGAARQGDLVKLLAGYSVKLLR